jgi:urease beta subunit
MAGASGYILGESPIEINAGRRTIRLPVRNTGDRPIQIGSHFHFFEVNRALDFDREQALGMRLNIPAGTAVRFEPGDEKEVELVELGGTRKVMGFNGLVNGSVRTTWTAAQALERAQQLGFRGARRALAEVS